MDTVPVKRQRIAVVGCGVAGLTAAWLLSRQHEVQLFEKNDYAGGHTRTLTVPDGPDAGTPVDTGFIVMNHRNYPLFTEVLRQLEIELDDSSMTFSFYDTQSDYGYSGNHLGSLFPSLGHYLNPTTCASPTTSGVLHASVTATCSPAIWISLASVMCARRGFSAPFLNHYLYPMGAAIWSSPIQSRTPRLSLTCTFLRTTALEAGQPSTVEGGQGRLAHLRAGNAATV